jgi:hypothetical protein
MRRLLRQPDVGFCGRLYDSVHASHNFLVCDTVGMPPDRSPSWHCLGPCHTDRYGSEEPSCRGWASSRGRTGSRRVGSHGPSVAARSRVPRASAAATPGPCSETRLSASVSFRWSTLAWIGPGSSLALTVLLELLDDAVRVNVQQPEVLAGRADLGLGEHRHRLLGPPAPVRAVFGQQNSTNSARSFGYRPTSPPSRAGGGYR